jgi:hypothetical protein
MTIPSLGNFLVPATLAAGAVFSVLTAPLALFGSAPVNVQLQGETIFDSKLKDVATPYLGLAGVLSLGVGITSLAVTGWRHSARQSEKVEQQLLGTQQQLRQKETQLQTLFLSDRHLEATGLEFFLEDETVIQQDHPAQSSTPSQPLIQTAAQVAQPMMVPAIPAIAPSQLTTPSQVTVQAAVSPLSAAQAFLSFSRSGTSTSPQASWTQVATSHQGAAIAQIHELQNQLQQILSQIETLQGGIQAQPMSTQLASVEPALAHSAKQRLHKVEPQRMMQVAAS